MEAWLLDKPTLLINPDIHFTRAELYKGSAIVENTEEFLAVLTQFDTEELAYFNQAHLLKERNAILTNAIGHADGLNHLRAIRTVMTQLNQIQVRNSKLPIQRKFLWRAFLLHFGKYFFLEKLFKQLPKFKKTVWIFKNHQLKEVKRLKSVLYPDLDDFYLQNKLNQRIHSGEIWKEL
jgi:hypothetical protein